VGDACGEPEVSVTLDGERCRGRVRLWREGGEWHWEWTLPAG
jgi:hypothetical protein